MSDNILMCVGRYKGKSGGHGLDRLRGFGRWSSSECICPNCGERMTFHMGTPCYGEQCPKCGMVMMRKYGIK